MSFLQALFRVFQYIYYLLVANLGMFSTNTQTPIVRVPSPKAVEGTGLNKLWGNTPLLHNFAGGPNGYGGSGLINVPIYKYANSTAGGSGKGTSPRNLIAFYYGFSSYMPTVTPVTEPLRWAIALFAKWIYWLDISLQVLYVHMFGIMNVAGNHQYFHGTNFAVDKSSTQGMSIGDWFYASQRLGLYICIIMFLCYLIATMIAPSSKAFTRAKTGFYCLFLGFGITCALPSLISFATYGANTVAESALGVNKGDMDANNMANQFFYNNVYSVPKRVLVYGMKPGQSFNNDSIFVGNKYLDGNSSSENRTDNVYGIENQPNSYIYDTGGHNKYLSSAKTPTFGIKSIKIPLKIINLDAMNAREKNLWNGLYNTSITSFLQDYGGDGDVLDEQTLSELQNLNGRSIKTRASNKALKRAYELDTREYRNTARIKNGHISNNESGSQLKKQRFLNHIHATNPSEHPHNGWEAFGDMVKNRIHMDGSTIKSEGYVKGRTDVLNNSIKATLHPTKAGTYGKTVQVDNQRIQNAENSGKTVKVYVAKNSTPNAQTIQARIPKQQPITLVHTTQRIPVANNSAQGVTYQKANNAGKKKIQNYAKQKARKSVNDDKSNIKQSAQSQANLKGNDLANIFEYHLSGIGPHAYLNKLTAFQTARKNLTPSINHSYAMYKVSWFNIFLGLLILLVVFVAFIGKLINAFFEAFVMYGVMDIMIARDMNDPRKMRQWIRNFFNLYAMVALDVVIIRIYFIAYFTVNNSVRQIFLSDMPRQIGGNLMVLGAIQGICDIALLMKCLEGNQAIDEALGRPSGAKNGWSHALAFMGAGYAVGRVGRGVGSAVGSLGQAGKGAFNGITKTGRGIGKGFAKATGLHGLNRGLHMHKNGIRHNSTKGGIHNNNSKQKAAMAAGVMTGGAGASTAGASAGKGATSQPHSIHGNANANTSSVTPSTNASDNSGDNNDNAVDLTSPANGSGNVDNTGANATEDAEANSATMAQSGRASNASAKAKKATTNNGEQVARALNKANLKANGKGKKSGVNFTGANNAANGTTKPSNHTPLTASQRQQMKAQQLRSKGHPITATGDKFFNGITHVGNGVNRAFGGHGTPINHDNDAAFSNPGTAGNPDEEYLNSLQDNGTGTADDDTTGEDNGTVGDDDDATNPLTPTNNDNDNNPTTQPTQPTQPHSINNSSNPSSSSDTSNLNERLNNVNKSNNISLKGFMNDNNNKNNKK